MASETKDSKTKIIYVVKNVIDLSEGSDLNSIEGLLICAQKYGPL